MATSADTAVLDSAVLDSAVLDSAVLDSAVLDRLDWSATTCRYSRCSAATLPTADRRPGDPVASVGRVGESAAAEALTAAGARAMRRRRARLAANRRPPSGMLPSTSRGWAAVAADRGDQVSDRSFPVPRWVRLTCTLCFAATAVLVAVVLLSSGGTRVVGPVVVQPGDTLWSVAQRSDPGSDPRAVIDRIKELNGLQGEAVVAGAVLQVPVATP